MKRLLLLLAATVLLSQGTFAQNANYAPGKVAFCPVFDTAFSGWSQEVTDLMQTKLTQIVMQNGVSSFSEQYVLTAKVALEDKQVTATAPAQYVVKLLVQLQAVDVNAQILIRELTLNITGSVIIAADFIIFFARNVIDFVIIFAGFIIFFVLNVTGPAVVYTPVIKDFIQFLIESAAQAITGFNDIFAPDITYILKITDHFIIGFIIVICQFFTGKIV